MADKELYNILCVDDEEGILKALRRILKSIDAKIFTAGSGEEGLEILKNNKIALIISDQKMPGMQGSEFLGKSRDISPDSIRILLTGYADIDATIEAINKGAIEYYLTKPWDDDNLISRIKESLNMFKVVEENKKLNRLIRLKNKKLKEMNDSLEDKVAEQTEEIRHKHKELTQTFMETIQAFSTIIEFRSKDVGSHSQRVASLSRELIKDYDLTQKELQDIIMAAFLHDIGKIGFSDKILTKSPSDYTNADIEEYKKHVIIGQSCIFKISDFEEIGLIIRYHHENYDGSGYPENLTADRIPFGSRVIRIIDSFDKKAFNLGYPDLEDIKTATAYLVQHTGTKFDPDLVKRFIEMDIGQELVRRESSEILVLKPQNLEVNMIVAQDIYTHNGMFLLPKGAVLSRGMINRLVNINKYDPIDKRVSVYKVKQEESKNERGFTIQNFIG